ncbi:hypothetical protein Q5H91_12350 [Sphingomonas sp. KR1UV-12]|uniref:EF-hand domain-containing protein n=1 Tax=Sphingomonas aurea TaxID=3063994 RepID=A0ABT9EM23_9SPHN|nr:hypothetical protein [Sphingomonas sp. KR1UV-12]MDP1028007.1 hypothetical protein [Sphingomonas sp. KR1UV-12]
MMRAGVAMMVLGLATAACGPGDDEKSKAADARAAAFTPPSVTSRLDYGSAAARRFRTLDRDGDDVISHDEMPRADSRLLELDRNKDGEITESEFSEGMLKRFDAMDLNQDGTVTSEERRTARAARKE